MDLSLFLSLYQYLTLKNFIIIVLLTSLIYLIRLIFDEDKAAIFRGKFFKILNYIINNREIDKKYIANDLKGRLNLARKEIHCGTMVLPKAIDVQWIENADPEGVNINEGEFVVRLDPSKKQPQNVVHLANIIVKKTTLIGLRHLTERPLQEAIDLTITKKILKYTNYEEAVSWFYTNTIYPLERRNRELKKWYQKIAIVDEQMLFNTILLVELEDFSRRIASLEPRPYMAGEIEYFVRYLYKIATKKEWEDVELCYQKAHLKVGTILVAKVDKVLSEGIDPYIQAAQNYIKKGMNTIYLIIWGKSYLRGIGRKYYHYNRMCKKLIDEIESLDRVTKYFEVKRYEYIAPDGSKENGRLIRYIVQGA